MVLFVESIILCVIFTFLILPPQFKNPLSQILSYPPAIRKRVESLPQYKDCLQITKQKNIARKVGGTAIAVIALAALSYFSGKITFGTAFIHVFILFFVVNMYDLIIFDFIIFPHSKKLVIPGTEDMVAEYKNPIHHIKGACKGIIIGTIAAALSAGLVELVCLFSACKESTYDKEQVMSQEVFPPESTVFQYNDVEYEITERCPSVNSLLGCTEVGEYIIIEGHVGPYHNYYGIFNTATQTFDRDIYGANPIYHDNDINTIVYIFWGDIYAYDGSLIASCDLGEIGYIKNISFIDDDTRIEVEIWTGADEMTTMVYDL